MLISFVDYVLSCNLLFCKIKHFQKVQRAVNFSKVLFFIIFIHVLNY